MPTGTSDQFNSRLIRPRPGFVALQQGGGGSRFGSSGQNRLDEINRTGTREQAFAQLGYGNADLANMPRWQADKILREGIPMGGSPAPPVATGPQQQPGLPGVPPAPGAAPGAVGAPGTAVTAPGTTITAPGNISLGGGGYDSEIRAGNAANVLGLQEAQRAAGRSSQLFDQALPGLESISQNVYQPAMEGNFGSTPFGINAKLNVMKEMERAKERMRQKGAMAGRDASDVAAWMGDQDIATAQALSQIPMQGLNQAQNFYTGLAGLAQGITPKTARIQTPGIAAMGITAPIQSRENLYGAEMARQTAMGDALSGLPYVA